MLQMKEVQLCADFVRKIISDDIWLVFVEEMFQMTAKNVKLDRAHTLNMLFLLLYHFQVYEVPQI